MIPCKRPRVLVDLHGSERWQADCYVPGCRWGYGNVIRSDVEEQARNHRQHHRAAVPKITYAKGSYGFTIHVTCSCGKRDGRATRADAEAWANYHLTHDHGLVTC